MIDLNNFRPLKDRILVRRIEREPMSNIILAPDIADQGKEGHRGTVLAVGSKVTGVKRGNTIRFGPYTDFEQDNLVLIQEDDIRIVEDC